MSEHENQTQSVAANFAHELSAPLSSANYALDLVTGHLDRLLDEGRLDYLKAGLGASVVAHSSSKPEVDKQARRKAAAIAHAPEMRALTQDLEGEDLDVALSLYEIGFGLKCAQLGVTTSQSIIKNLRNFSQLKDTTDQTVEIYETIKTALAVTAHKTRTMKTTWEVQKVPEITANPFALTQVWMNILKNAAESGAQNMKIELLRHGSDLRVIFSNDHTHIPANLDVFAKGSTYGKEKGNGIGLWMCKEIVQAHGGMISARNIDNGVEFFVELPLK